MYCYFSFRLKKSICSFDLMKNLIFSMLLMISVSSIHAQQSDTLAPTSKFKTVVGQYYFEAGMHIGQIFSKKVAMTTHFSGNIVLYKKFHLGAQYERLTNYLTIPLFSDDSLKAGDYNFMHQSAGIRFGYAIFHTKKYQLQPSVSINWAMIKYSLDEFSIHKWNFCVIEPGINFSYIVHKNVSLGAGVHYRLNLGLSQALSNKDLNGMYGNIFVRFGFLQ